VLPGFAAFLVSDSIEADPGVSGEIGVTVDTSACQDFGDESFGIHQAIVPGIYLLALKDPSQDRHLRADTSLAFLDPLLSAFVVADLSCAYESATALDAPLFTLIHVPFLPLTALLIS
jgi:hypothetical protein